MTIGLFLQLEREGVVFLPASGCTSPVVREPDSKYHVEHFNECGNYYTSTKVDNSQACFIGFDDDKISFLNNENYGRSVRLVQKQVWPEIEPEFVDLGLPSGTLWADVNVGATAKTGNRSFGNYYAWGETAPWYKSISGTALNMKSEYAGYNSTVYSSSSNMRNITADLTGEYILYDVADIR